MLGAQESGPERALAQPEHGVAVAHVEHRVDAQAGLTDLEQRPERPDLRGRVRGPRRLDDAAHHGQPLFLRRRLHAGVDRDQDREVVRERPRLLAVALADAKP